MQVTTPSRTAKGAKLPSNRDLGLIKKLKGFDGLVVSLGNGDAGSGEVSQRFVDTLVKDLIV